MNHRNSISFSFCINNIILSIDFENPNSQLTILLDYLSKLRGIINKLIDEGNIENNIKNRKSQYSSNKKPNEVYIC